MNMDFENINMTNLRDVLSLIFFGTTDEKHKKYVVPLQGNWYNPSQVHKVDNWIGYVINSTSSDVAIVSQGNKFYRECQTDITLSFIGVDAEKMAQSVLFWLVREDVKSILDKKYKGVINNKEFEVYSSLYLQEGLNSTICWNVDFSIQHNMLLRTDIPVLHRADLSGTIIIGG